MFNQNQGVNKYGTNMVTTNLAMQKSQSQVWSAFKSMQSILSQPLMMYEKSLSKQAELSKKDLANQINKEKNSIKKLKSLDATRMSALTARMNDIKRKNDELLRRALELQDVIIEIASTEGRLQVNQMNIQRQNEIYKNSNEVRRLTIEMDKKLYDIETSQQISTSTSDPISISLKEMQVGIEQIGVDSLRQSAEIRAIRRMVLKRE